MRNPAEASQLKDMVRLRALQFTLAEKQSQKMGHAVDDAKERCATARSDLGSTIKAWRTAIEGPCPDMMIISGWSIAVCDSRDDLQARERDVEQARENHSQAEEAWRLALLRKDVTEQLYHDAQRALHRKSDERATFEAGERHIVRRLRP